MVGSNHLQVKTYPGSPHIRCSSAVVSANNYCICRHISRVTSVRYTSQAPIACGLSLLREQINVKTTSTHGLCSRNVHNAEFRSLPPSLSHLAKDEKSSQRGSKETVGSLECTESLHVLSLQNEQSVELILAKHTPYWNFWAWSSS